MILQRSSSCQVVGFLHTLAVYLVAKGKFTYVDHRVHVAFGSGELSWIFDPNQHDEVQIMPHVVFILNVLLEANCFIVEGGSIQS